MSERIFCKIVAGELPASKIAFMDLGQVNPCHVIVAVKPHVKNIYGLSEELVGLVFQTATRVAKAVKQTMQPDGMPLLQANEKAGYQNVSPATGRTGHQLFQFNRYALHPSFYLNLYPDKS